VSKLVRKLSVAIRGNIPGFNYSEVEHREIKARSKAPRGRELIRGKNNVFLASIVDRAFDHLIPVALYVRRASNGQKVTTMVFVDGEFEKLPIERLAVAPMEIQAFRTACRGLHKVIAWANPDADGNPDDSVVIMGSVDTDGVLRRGHQNLRLGRANNKLVAYIEPNG
jgi:hypothetical protein